MKGSSEALGRFFTPGGLDWREDTVSREAPMTRSTNSAPPLRRLLVGTDFSPGATRALTRVPHLPLGTGATVTLIHVLPAWMNRAVHARDFGRVERRLRAEATRLLRALREAGRKQVRVGTVLVQGSAPAEILRRSAAADLVIVGRHGRRSFRDLLVGSTAERVVQRATVPTLVVARRARTPYRRPLAALDLSDASRPTLDGMARVLGPSGPSLDVVHAYHPAHEQVLHRVAGRAGSAAYDRECRTEARRAVSRLVGASAAASLSRPPTLRRTDPRRAILSAARARKADLIALGSHGRAGLTRWLLGSVSEAVVRHATCDVLVTPPRGASRSRSRRAA
jgi:nucleotide-binding universal stress UspA family protein